MTITNSLRRHYPDQVIRVEDLKSSSQPIIQGSPFYLIKGSIDHSRTKVKEDLRKMIFCKTDN